MAIEWKLVESSNVAAIGYENHDDEMTAELHVQFKSGAEYIYQDVPEEVVKEFLDASSKGKFFAQNIKGVFAYAKVG